MLLHYSITLRWKKAILNQALRLQLFLGKLLIKFENCQFSMTVSFYRCYFVSKPQYNWYSLPYIKNQLKNSIHSPLSFYITRLFLSLVRYSCTQNPERLALLKVDAFKTSVGSPGFHWLQILSLILLSKRLLLSFLLFFDMQFVSRFKL